MAANFPLAEAKLVGNFLATLLFGFHTVAFGFGLRYLLWGPNGKLKGSSAIGWILLTAGVTMWLLAALDVSLSLYENIQGFALYTGPGGPVGFFTQSRWSGDLRVSASRIQSLVRSLMSFYRHGFSWEAHYAAIL
jgi:hypothetical protein